MERSREVDGKLTGGKRSAIASRVTVATEKFQHFVGEIARLGGSGASMGLRLGRGESFCLGFGGNFGISRMKFQCLSFLP
jgi:hypothetical protein